MRSDNPSGNPSIAKRATVITAAVFAALLGCATRQATNGTSSTLTTSETHAGGTSGRPILDTHVHLYQVTRPGGVPWPPPAARNLYRDILPDEYKALAKQHGIIGTGIVEANPTVEEALRILDLVKGDDFFKFVVASLEIGSPTFTADLDRLARDERVVGIRGFLWSPKLTLDARQLASLKELEQRGMTLDLISRGDLNPKDKIEELAIAVPKLLIIIDHLGGAKGETPDPAWVASMEKLARQPNVHVKFSSFFDMFNPSASEDQPWQSPPGLAAYRAHFDVVMRAFGEDRLVWGSNWPVVQQGGDIGKQIALAEEYLSSYGNDVRDKVMYKNAQSFYRRH